MIKNCIKCNTEYKTKPSHAGRRKYCSYFCYHQDCIGKKRPQEAIEKHRAKMIGKLAGEKNPMWKGGITPLHYKIRNSLQYKKWRSLIFERDNYTCVMCGIKSKKGQAVYLQADHIKPFAFFPEIRLSLDNGRTLCIDCHKKTETYGVRNYKQILQFN